MKNTSTPSLRRNVRKAVAALRSPPESARRLEWMGLDSITPALRNPKRHHGDLRRSLTRFGYVEPMVLDERTERLVAGHGRLEHLHALRADAAAPPDGVQVVDGAWQVQVLRGWSSKDDREAEAYLVASNRLGEAGGWDSEGLDALMKDLLSADAAGGIGFSAEDLESLIGETKWDLPANAAPAAPVTLFVQPGQVWHLGRHRVICGSSLEAENLKLILETPVDAVLTDPPYGIKVNTRSFSTGRSRIGNAKDFPVMQGDQDADVARRALELARGMKPDLMVFWGANNFTDAVPPATSWVVWDKREEMGSNDQADAELAWSNRGGPVRVFHHLWNGLHRASERGEARVHPTQKPVALGEWLLTEYARKKPTAVLDLFLGSGSMLLACEAQGVPCYGADLEPQYVQAIIDRWELTTGERARCVSGPPAVRLEQ